MVDRSRRIPSQSICTASTAERASSDRMTSSCNFMTGIWEAWKREPTIDLRPSAYQVKARNCDRTSHPRTSQDHSYLCPGIGGATSVLLNEQWPTPSLILTTPHCTGSTAAFSSPSGGWHAALMALLQVATSGMPAGHFLNPVAPVARTIKVPTTIVNMIAPDE